jgi:hypothetical protein
MYDAHWVMHAFLSAKKVANWGIGWQTAMNVEQ